MLGCKPSAIPGRTIIYSKKTISAKKKIVEESKALVEKLKAKILKLTHGLAQEELMSKTGSFSEAEAEQEQSIKSALKQKQDLLQET